MLRRQSEVSEEEPVRPLLSLTRELVEEVPDVSQLKLPCGFGCLPPCRVVLEGVQVDLTRVGDSPFR